MFISAHSVATTQQFNDTDLLLPGNVVPHFWYSKFKEESGGPDLISITILSEIVFWFRPSTYRLPYITHNLPQLIDGALAISYEYLEQKFCLGKERVRRALVRLEAHNILTRNVRNTKLASGKRGNQLFIHLEEDFLNSCFRDPELELQHEFNSKIQSQHQCGDHISNKNKNYKNRSIGSNFIQNSLSDLKIDEVEEDRKLKTNTPLLPSIVLEEQNLSNLSKYNSLSDKSYLGKTKNLQDFYPLSQEECLELKHLSGRDFSLNAMNEILKDVARKKPEWSCGSKKGFMTYMTEVLKFEKRQAVLVSGEGFRIRNNLSAEEINSKVQEKFLAEIENSTQTSPELHFKKKLAAVLDPNTAYRLLKAYSSSSREGDIFKINLTTTVELTSIEKEIILQQAKATHEKLYGEELVLISKLDFTIKENARAAMQATKDEAVLIPSGVWGNMRLKLMKHFGSEGKALDESWFSKLSAEVDEQERVVRLKAPTTFMKDWINNKYGSLLDGLCQTEQLNFSGVQ
jgi:hypothetical protein